MFVMEVLIPKLHKPYCFAIATHLAALLVFNHRVAYAADVRNRMQNTATELISNNERQQIQTSKELTQDF